MGTTGPGISGKAIMVVEDEYLIALTLEMALSEQGAHVMGPYSSVDAALEALSATPWPDAAVLDINVRERLVFPVAEKLTELDIPFVFATGYDNWTVPAVFSTIRRFEKPTDTDRLIVELSNMLAARDTSGAA
ncbi:response regulator [Pelagibacterium luteolum]|uniref:Response regulatory domain-containing protein n=1 Tax=Pelagibacterium luteolum TaxID=440168 RepID=A0A1G8A216_9HYPH|nr:response regulator [Pelagibacterium luteolum]SDH14948.1 hypothetical protein SAMN04487974_12510 [Pelagibacterium luteolum]